MNYCRQTRSSFPLAIEQISINSISQLNSSQLPQLLYVGDVPVESAVGGSLLLYRLLLEYPVSRLHVLESNLHTSDSKRRLPDVAYGKFWLAWPRPLRTRFNKIYALSLMLVASRRIGPLIRVARKTGAEAILTVSHGYSWLTAAAAARALDLPLHLIAHDEWLATLTLPVRARPWAQRVFCALYRQATSRLCVSPYMVSKYRRDCGVEGEVLYPSCAPCATSSTAQCADARIHTNGLVFGYAGSFHTLEYARRMTAVAIASQPVGGLVRVFSPSSPSIFGDELPKNLEICPPISSDEVVRRLRSECDVLVVPMSFEPQHAENMSVCFPSKLADYAATGLPLLIWGPDYSSANVWAKEEGGGVAEIVETESDVDVAAAVLRLANDPAHRLRLGRRARERGEACFSHAEVTRRFFDVLSSKCKSNHA